MAIVKATYTKSRQGAKASLRYIAHRPGKDGKRATRTLFGTDGVMGKACHPPILAKRHSLPPPELAVLPQLETIRPWRATLNAEQLSYGYIDPDM